MSSLRRGHANLLCIVPILVYVLPKREHCMIHMKDLYSQSNCIVVSYALWLMNKPPLYLVCVIISVIVLNREDYLK